MLDSEEIDDDYFTPIPNTSLKNIFGNTLQTSEAEDLLKYVPPKAEVKNVKSTGEKANKCIFACALRAYEWSENAYKSKGKVGFAIIKALETDSHSIVLYDSNKTPQSKTSVTPNLIISINDNVQLSFYDDQRKYWVMAGLETEMSQIRENLQNIGVKINDSQQTDKSKPTALSCDEDNCQHESTIPHFNQSLENETDSSDDMKNKALILNRMASMGQPVLPRQTLSRSDTNRDLSSSSTDSDSTIPSNTFSTMKKVHHLPPSTVKAKSTKKIAPEMVVSDVFQQSDSHASQLFHMRHRQVVPFTNPTTSTMIKTVCTNGNTGDLNNLMSEQRISNTELRININKTTDKVDQILEILKNPTSQRGMNHDFEIEIMKKLLNEYEEKIKKYEREISVQCSDQHIRQLLMKNEQKINEYEENIRILSENNLKMQSDYENQIIMLKKKIESCDQKESNDVQGFPEAHVKNHTLTNVVCNPVEDSDTQALKNKIRNLEDTIIEKNNSLSNLQLQIQEDNKKHLVMLSEKDSYYSQEIERLQQIIAKNRQDSEDDDKLKNVMNKVFQLIAVNFENDEQYSGGNVKKVVAAIIKKTTYENISTL